MIFCKKCGSLLIPKKKAGKNVMACSSCGKVFEEAGGVIKEEIRDRSPAVEVIEKEIETLPLVEADCQACGHNKGYFWEIQTRAADEPATRFYKCEKCKKIWREYK
jgi:transcription factor S